MNNKSNNKIIKRLFYFIFLCNLSGLFIVTELFDLLKFDFSTTSNNFFKVRIRGLR